MKHLEEKAKFSAEWTVDLIESNFSTYPNINAYRKSLEKLIKNYPDKTNPKLKFLEVELEHLKSIQSDITYTNNQLARVNHNDLVTVKFKDEEGGETMSLLITPAKARIITRWLKNFKYSKI